MKPSKILILSESSICFSNIYSDYAEIKRQINPGDSFQNYILTAVDFDSKIALKEFPLSTVAFSEEFTNETEAEMKSKSIPFYLNHNYLTNSLEKIIRIFSKLNTEKKIAVFSPDKERNTILKAVLRLFNYDMIEIYNFNDLFSLNDSEISFIFADISSKSFSSEQYVKKALFGRLKFIPFIPFYTENGIGISDIACGLNKVARFILSFDEMMSFISHNFSSHEIFNENRKLNDFFHSHKNKTVFSLDLKSDYHQNYQSMVLTSKDFSDSDEGLVSQISKLDECMTKRELVKWFIIDDNSARKSKA